MTTLFPENRTTARLLLSRITATDYPDLQAMQQDPRVMATLGGMVSETELQARHERNLEHWRQHGFGWWVARLRSDGRFVGRGGLRRANVDGKDEVEVGYGLIPEFWGQGLAVELAAASIEPAMSLQLDEIVCFTLPTNLRSRRVMEKVGFRYEKDFVWCGLPHVLYRLKGLASKM